MTLSLTAIFLALASFVVTFTIARSLAKWRKKRKWERAQLEEQKNQSRQVRRARERSKKSR